MNDIKIGNNFKSYVGLEDFELQSLNTVNDDSVVELSPRLLTGEVQVAEAQNVLMFAPLCELKQGKSGILVVTNFKLSFVTTDGKPRDETGYQQNLLLGDYDICLSNVDAVYQVSGEKKRRLHFGPISGKVKGLHIVCKNMKVFTFSFKFSPLGHGRILTNALLHYAFPRRPQLLFSYDYREPYYSTCRNVVMFRDRKDWESELERTKCSDWRVSAANNNFQMSVSLPQWLVVPAGLVDWQLGNAAGHFRGNRPPVWCWGTDKGAALIRMADIQSSITTREKENAMLESVRKSHPKRAQPVLMDLTKDVPAPRDIHASYLKLREICAPENVRQFWIQDNNFLGLVDSSRWFHHISSCLYKAREVAEIICSGITVALQEGEGRDTCCIVGSLVQLLIDPHWRSVAGFQSLIQKEWVALGHKFCTRLGHVSGTESEQSFEFLLFLDCVWQLLNQLPVEFEFTETYLTSLWDSCHIPIFDTFLFDCERDRSLAENEPNNPMILRSVWDWGEQFPEKDIALFYNPLYVSKSENKENGTKFLPVRTSIPFLEFWSQCYFRWMPLIEIPGGGRPQQNLQLLQLAAEIKALRKKLSGSEPSQVQQPPSDVGSFFPFGYGHSKNAVILASSLNLDSSFGTAESLIDSQSLLNAD